MILLNTCQYKESGPWCRTNDMRRATRIAALVLLSITACAKDDEVPLDFGYAQDDLLRLHHVQMKGSHNSYHVAPSPAKLDEWNYTHAPLYVQLEEQGARQFELDVHYSTTMQRFLVYHLPGADAGSTCETLGDCLQELRRWSDEHRGHHPLVVFVEPKDVIDAPEDAILGHYDELDAAILAVWPRSRVLVPDDVQGDSPSLAEAVTGTGWPTLGDLRGKALFVLLDGSHSEGGHHFEYTRGGKNLDGRVLFVTAEVGDPYAAILSLDDPVVDAQKIADAASRGFLVRTRPVDPVEEGKALERTQLDTALKSQAHMISSDYLTPGVVENYVLDLGGTPSRCHPLSPPGCTAQDVESPARLEPISR